MTQIFSELDEKLTLDSYYIFSYKLKLLITLDNT
jgi:hypothetical protein